MEILLIIGSVVAVLVLWMNIVASIAVRYDQTLEPFQRVAQLVFIWVVPIIGASIALKLIIDHSPEVIPRSWIPWPFKKMLFGKRVKPNKNRSEYGVDTYPGYEKGPGDFGGSSGGDSGGGD